MILKKGDKNKNVKILQEFLGIKADGDFGPGTETAVMKWQLANGLTDDGIVGPKTQAKMGIVLKEETTSEYFDTKYKDKTIEGSHFPDKPIYDTVRVKMTKEIKEEYLPAMEKALAKDPKGLQLLCTIMAIKEGFYKGTRSYRYNNPGNIGNTDSGANKGYPTLEAGILRQKEYITQIAAGKHSAYPMGKEKVIKPYYSKEIAKNSKLYGMSPYVPGYRFIFTGQLDQFVKIYSTGARAGNSYLSMIISYFKKNGIDINAQSKIQDIIELT
jgi:hypothetical protein